VKPPRVDDHPSTVLVCLVAKLILKVPPPMLACMLQMSGDSTGMVQALVCTPKCEKTPGLESYLSVEGSSPRWTDSVGRRVHPYPRRLTCYLGGHGGYVCSGGRVPMPRIDGLETNTREIFCQARMGGCLYVLSCQALYGVASQEPNGHGACLVLKSPWVTRRVCNERTGGKIISIHDRAGGLVWFVPESSSF
jgi:hypothetical protein